MNFVVATHVNKHVSVYQHDSLESALERCSHYNQDNGYADLYTDDPNFTHGPLESGPIWYVEHLALVSPRSIIEGTLEQKLLVNDYFTVMHMECQQDIDEQHQLDQANDEAYMEWIQSKEGIEFMYDLEDKDDESLCIEDDPYERWEQQQGSATALEFTTGNLKFMELTDLLCLKISLDERIQELIDEEAAKIKSECPSEPTQFYPGTATPDFIADVILGEIEK